MASSVAFAAASIELLSRLWLELDRLHEFTARALASSAPAPPDVRIEILRLEIVIVLEACDSAVWRTLLTASQRGFLRRALEGLLGDLAVAVGDAECGAIEQAQDRLLRAMLAQGRVAATPMAPPPGELRVHILVGGGQR